MKRFFAMQISWVTLAVLVTACVPQPTLLPTAEPLAPTVTRQADTSTPVVVQSPTPVPQPTGTNAPSSTVIPATTTPTWVPTPLSLYPTADSSTPLSSSGPWLAYLTGHEKGSWHAVVTNPDGSGQRPLPLAIGGMAGSPASPYLAVLSPVDGSAKYAGALNLEIVRLPDLKIKTIPLITSPDIETYDYRRNFLFSTQEDALQLIKVAVDGGYAWSPNGRYLAFTAAIDGPTTDLYVYDTRSDQVRRLTEGSEMATIPEWSPDSQWIVHRGINAWGEGCYETGVWAAAADGSQVKWLSQGQCFEITRWTGPETFEVYAPSEHGGARTPAFFYFRNRIDIAAGTSTFLEAVKPAFVTDITSNFDCFTKKASVIDGYYDSAERFDSPDRKWFAVVSTRLAIYSADGKLVTQFGPIDRFGGWQPGTDAVVFTIPGMTSGKVTLNYFQPADRSLKAVEGQLGVPTSPYQVIWTGLPSSFFIESSDQAGSTYELDVVDLLKGQILKVDWSIGEISDTDIAWIGVPEMKVNTIWMPCRMKQP